MNVHSESRWLHSHSQVWWRFLRGHDKINTCCAIDPFQVVYKHIPKSFKYLLRRCLKTLQAVLGGPNTYSQGWKTGGRYRMGHVFWDMTWMHGWHLSKQLVWRMQHSSFKGFMQLKRCRISSTVWQGRTPDMKTKLIHLIYEVFWEENGRYTSIILVYIMLVFRGVRLV